MKLICLDFETFYAADYSLRLKKYNTSGYIRDRQFQVHGVGIKIDGGKTKWYAGHAAAKKAVDAINWSDAALLAHNTAFDGAVLAWHFGHIAAFYYDTLSMTRGLHNEVSRAKLDTIAKLYGLGEKYVGALENTKGKKTLTKVESDNLGAYCVQDTELCYAIFQKQKAVFPVTELALIDLTLRMFIQPVFQINLAVAEKALAEELEERTWLITAAGCPEKSLTSNPKFALELEKLGVTVPMKISLTTGKETYAFAQTDEEFLELLEHDDRRVVRLAAGRLAAKSTLFETRGRRLIDDGTKGLRLPVLLNYFGAKTGRWSGGNKTNMQNLPRLERTDAGTIIERGTGMLRLSVEAPLGHRICVADSAQIEARTIVWLAGQSDIVELFARGEDVYCHMASIIYGRTITKKDKLERFIGKIAVLGLGYGMGHVKFQTTLAMGIMGPPVDLSLAECKRIVVMFRKANSKVTQLWKVAEDILTDLVRGQTGSYSVDGQVILEWEDETVWLPNGMGLHYPELRWNNGFSYLANGKRKKIYGGLLVENCIAGGTRVLTDKGWCKIENVTTDMLVHDGVEFIQHGGSLLKSVQECVRVCGVYMTPDHKVLTDEGWKPALEKPRPYKPVFRELDSGKDSAFYRTEDVVAVQMSVRERDRQSRNRRNAFREKRADPQLWVPDQNNTIRSEDAWDEQASCIPSVAQYEGSLQSTDTSSLEELRWQRDNSLQKVGLLSSVLDGHGGFVQSWIDTGTQEQQPGVHAVELCVGDNARPDYESSQFTESRHSDVVSTDGNQSFDVVLPTEPRVVFDIINCGPRQRFVVLGDEGPFIVHNCVQALARILVSDQMLDVAEYLKKFKLKKGEVAQIGLMTHDEIVAVAPDRYADKLTGPVIKGKQQKGYLIEAMRVRPSWAQGVPLDAEGGHAVRYEK